MKTIFRLFATLVFLIGFTLANAAPSFTVTDLGTLGGNTSSANSVAGNGANAEGMIVGSSTTADNSEHAFLFVEDKMYDLNNLCDLSQTNFKVLTVARTISDSLVIIGDGITKNGDKHAFKLTPQSVAGGQWHYQCCQWVWIQDGGGWWWEEGCGCYKWHGPPGPHPPCPPENPPCWEYPFPCPPPIHRPTPTPTPGGPCWCCINGEVVQTTPEECRDREGQCYPTREEALQHCKNLRWCCLDGRIFQTDLCDKCRYNGGQCYDTREEALRHCRQQRTPTPPPNKTPTPPITYIPGVQQTPTPPIRKSPTPSRKRGKQSPTTNIYTARPVGQSTATPPTRGTSGKKKRGSPTPYGKP